MDFLQNAGLSAAIGNPALTGLSGAATTHSYTAFAVVINGIYSTIPANAGVATPVLDALTGLTSLPLAASQGAIYMWMVQADSTDGIVQSYVKNLDTNGNFIWDSPILPPVPSPTLEWVPYAYVVVKNSAAGATWRIGSQNWNATGISIVVKNFITLPARIALT